MTASREGSFERSTRSLGAGRHCWSRVSDPHGRLARNPHALVCRSNLISEEDGTMAAATIVAPANGKPNPAPGSNAAHPARAHFAAFSHHGKPLRGLMST